MFIPAIYVWFIYLFFAFLQGFLPLLVSTLYTFIKNEKSVTHSVSIDLLQDPVAIPITSTCIHMKHMIGYFGIMLEDFFVIWEWKGYCRMLSTSNQNSFTKRNLTAIIVLRALNYLNKCWMLSQKFTRSFHEFPIYISNTNLIIVTGILPSLDNFLCCLVNECDCFDGNSACHR